MRNDKPGLAIAPNCRACYVELRKNGESKRGRTVGQAEFRELFLVRATELRRYVSEALIALRNGNADLARAVLERAEDFDALHGIRQVQAHGQDQTDTG